jgi:Flp pilus assembly CpaE family ATPase
MKPGLGAAVHVFVMETDSIRSILVQATCVVISGNSDLGELTKGINFLKILFSSKANHIKGG